MNLSFSPCLLLSSTSLPETTGLGFYMRKKHKKTEEEETDQQRLRWSVDGLDNDEDDGDDLTGGRCAHGTSVAEFIDGWSLVSSWWSSVSSWSTASTSISIEIISLLLQFSSCRASAADVVQSDASAFCTKHVPLRNINQNPAHHARVVPHPVYTTWV